LEDSLQRLWAYRLLSGGKFVPLNLVASKFLRLAQIEKPVGDFPLKGIRRPLTAYNVLASKAAD
jgi:hypothetical protein